MNGYPSCSNVLVDFTLTLLPALSPEPYLVSRHRQHRPEFNDTVLALEDFNLGTGSVQMQAAAQISGHGDQMVRIRRG
ncbi:MAG: hypothetical protein ACYCZY_10690 [Lacisediminihabitans sp.]